MGQTKYWCGRPKTTCIKDQETSLISFSSHFMRREEDLAKGPCSSCLKHKHFGHSKVMFPPFPYMAKFSGQQLSPVVSSPSKGYGKKLVCRGNKSVMTGGLEDTSTVRRAKVSHSEESAGLHGTGTSITLLPHCFLEFAKDYVTTS